MNKLSKRNLIVGMGIIMAVIMIISLFILRIGVGDNGSQVYTLEKMGLYDPYLSAGSGIYSPGYGVATKNFSGMSYALVYDIIKAFMPVNSVLPVYIPSIIYLLILILSAAFIMNCIYSEKYKGMSITAAVLLILMFCDSAYCAYLNTPYKYGAVFVFSFAMTASVFSIMKNNKWYSYLCFLIFGCLFAKSSTVTAIFGIVLGIYFIKFAFTNKSVFYKIISVICSVFILISGLSSVTEDKTNMYDSFFYGAALENPNALKYFGLDDSYNDYINVPSFDEKAQALINSDKFKNDFSKKVTFGKMVVYNLKNFRSFKKNMKNVGYNSTSIRTAYLPGFSSAAKSGKNTSWFILYSTVKSKAFPASFVFFAIILLALIIVSSMYKKEYADEQCEKGICDFSIIFAVCTLITYPLPFLLNGMTQIGFNMFIFNLMFDICLFFLIIVTGKLLFAKKNILKEKYGVNQ